MESTQNQRTDGEGIVSSLHTTEFLLEDYDEDEDDDDDDDDDSSFEMDESEVHDDTGENDDSGHYGATEHTYQLDDGESETEAPLRVLVSGVPSSFFESNSGASEGEGRDFVADDFDDEDDEDEGSGGSRSIGDISVSKEAPDVMTKRVWCTRTLVLMTLLIFGGIAGALTFTKMRDDQIRDFEESFQNVASEVIRVANENGRKLASSMEAFASLYPSYGNVVEGTRLPLIMLNDFEAFAGSTRSVTRSSLLLFSPYLTQGSGEWNDFSVGQQKWIHRSFQLYNSSYTGHPADHEPIPTSVYFFDQEHGMINSTEQIVSPVWQMSPPPLDTSVVNFDLLSEESIGSFVNDIVQYEKPMLSRPMDISKLSIDLNIESNGTFHSLYAQPVLSKFHGNHEVVGTVIASIAWDAFFNNSLSNDAFTVTVVIESCGSYQTLLVGGTRVTFVAPYDAHDSRYDGMREKDESFVLNNKELPDSCQHVLYVYPNREFQNEYQDSQPAAFLVLVIFIFLFAIVVFFLYDMIASFRQKTTQRKANEQDALAEKFFPSHVRKQLINVAAASDEFKAGDPNKRRKKRSKRQYKEDGRGNKSTGSLDSHESIQRVIADLYPETTIMFADIPGFTAWSSIREPPHIFMLLEAIFLAFDRMAKRRKVFKVETVGDCYVAAVGVPEANKDHAVIMARFARSCLRKFEEIVRGLELTLGPDTSELGMRIGLHSGPITAGVLRGERARFQLFGDTMNTTARIQTTGSRDCIHVSEQTASFLMAAGNKDWVVPRPDPVQAKGKGLMTTFWLKTPARGDMEYSSSGYDSAADLSDAGSEMSEENTENAAKALNLIESKLHAEDRSTLTLQPAESSRVAHINSRLVAWNSELLSQLLKRIIAHRNAKNAKPKPNNSLTNAAKKIQNGRMVVDEVVEVIALPEFESDLVVEDPRAIELSPDLQKQLEGYVQTISCMYRDNPFHNFEHASHVTMSVSKLLSRIVAPQSAQFGKQLSNKDLMKDQHELHDHTYGITSDPLTQFAVVLSALVHDVDHRGVPNFVLAKEDTAMAGAYQNKSIAEQNSVDIAWETLFLGEYRDLRNAIFTTESELRRFRQLLVNSVIATDIFDKELSAARKARWEKSFSKESIDTKEDIDRKATIVIEHLIQASDVAHTMQHWQVYLKWNYRLFQEMYGAYLAGRTANDPSEKWYEGEIGFFDNYIIPLAKKLKDCGVFGVSSDEYLNYAEHNRRLWEEKGQSVVAEMVLKVKEQGLA